MITDDVYDEHANTVHLISESVVIERFHNFIH